MKFHIIINGQHFNDKKGGKTFNTFAFSCLILYFTKMLHLQVAGCSFASVVKATVLLADIKDFVKVNNVYKEFFPDQFPARAAYQVPTALPG